MKLRQIIKSIPTFLDLELFFELSYLKIIYYYYYYFENPKDFCSFLDGDPSFLGLV